MEKLTFLLHSLDDDRVFPKPLTTFGKYLANKKAPEIAHMHFDSLFYSPDLNTKKTAEILNEYLHLPLNELSPLKYDSFSTKKLLIDFTSEIEDKKLDNPLIIGSNSLLQDAFKFFNKEFSLKKSPLETKILSGFTVDYTKSEIRPLYFNQL